MNENVQGKQNSKGILTMLVLILTMVVCVTSATYAYLAMSASNNTTVTGTIANVGLSLSVSQVSPSTEITTKMVPQLDKYLSEAMGTSYNCVDENGNVVCKVYSITVSSSSTATVKATGTITFTNASAENLEWQLATNATTLGDLDAHAATNGTTLDISTGSTTVNNSYTLEANGSTTLYLVVWLSETGEEQDDSGTWSAEITFSSGTNGVTSTITGTTTSTEGT